MAALSLLGWGEFAKSSRWGLNPELARGMKQPTVDGNVGLHQQTE